MFCWFELLHVCLLIPYKLVLWIYLDVGGNVRDAICLVPFLRISAPCTGGIFPIFSKAQRHQYYTTQQEDLRCKSIQGCWVRPLRHVLHWRQHTKRFDRSAISGSMRRHIRSDSDTLQRYTTFSLYGDKCSTWYKCCNIIRVITWKCLLVQIQCTGVPRICHMYTLYALHRVSNCRMRPQLQI